MKADASGAPAFFKQPTETWRWYAWTRMRPEEKMRWVATCWHGDTVDEALEKRLDAEECGEHITLVCETVSYIPQDEFNPLSLSRFPKGSRWRDEHGNTITVTRCFETLPGVVKLWFECDAGMGYLSGKAIRLLTPVQDSKT